MHKQLVISVDAMIAEDVEYLRSKQGSNFRKIMAHGACVENMRSIYPSSTYPAHATMATGCYPEKTGIYQNAYLKVLGGKKGWIYDHGMLQVEDIFAAAKRAGKTTACVYWPVMGNNPNVDYLVNEYFFPDPKESLPEGFAGQGANEETLRIIESCAHLFPVKDKTNPEPRLTTTADNFANGVCCGILRQHKPDVMLYHISYVDTFRHLYGVLGEKIHESLDVVDAFLGNVLAALQDAGTLEQTNIFIVSDHGQREITTRVNLNLLLMQYGLVDADENGNLIDWQAYCQGYGGSAPVFLKTDDPALQEKTKRCLRELAKDPCSGIEKVWLRQEVKEKYHLDGDFYFMLEAADGISFAEGLKGECIAPFPKFLDRYTRATHGYQPEKGKHPVFWAAGPDIRADARVEYADIADIAPTVAALIGADLPCADGKALLPLLK